MYYRHTCTREHHKNVSELVCTMDPLVSSVVSDLLPQAHQQGVGIVFQLSKEGGDLALLLPLPEVLVLESGQDLICRTTQDVSRLCTCTCMCACVHTITTCTSVVISMESSNSTRKLSYTYIVISGSESTMH